MWGTQIRQWDDIDVRDFSVDQGLYTAILYEQLENSLTSTSYDNYCGTSDTPLHGDRNIRNICATILNYLETTYSKSDHTYDPYDVCKLLNYWVYNSLNNVLHFSNSNNFNKISKVHGDIVIRWNNFNEDKLKETENKTCKPIINIAAYNDWEKRKELYEYYVDYSPIKTFLDFYPQGCRKFYHYVESKKKLYEHFKKHCTSDKKKGCPDFYEQCEKYDPDIILPTLKCRQEIINERKEAEHSALQRAKAHSVDDPNAQDESDDIKSFGASKLNKNSNNIRMYGNVLLGVVATSMTSGALYRVNINSLIQINRIS
ncbi:hypothetical protein PVNG_04727 [Plasmodium vivax North Korean]|uniref:Variable surface protein Vir4 n=1 Tax=Plasmodium vivax North Korean TaxID=1035514 RepID=A0A0J9U0C5_PLAVI|nr:hypothetical protein PVNG_04727 [Plasmodium vivax North Korean]